MLEGDELRDPVIEKGFPELLAEDIQIEYRSLRDFGRPLILFLKYAEEKGHLVYREDGLSIREVKLLFGIKSD